MEHLIHDVRSVLKRPSLLLQYAVLNFFLLSVSTAAVVYIKKEAVIEYQQGKAEIILNAAKNLNHFDLPGPLNTDVDHIVRAATESQDAVTSSRKSEPVSK